MRRILHVVGSMDRAGAETMILNLYRTIDKTEIQFDFIYFTNKKCDYDDEIEVLGGNIYRISTKNPIKRMNLLTKLLKDNPQWSVVHCHTLFSNSFHILSAYRAGVKQRIAHSHSTNDKVRHGFFATLYHIISRKILLSYSTHFVACGHAAAEYLFPKVTSTLILPNAIDTNYFATIGANYKSYLKNEFKLSEDTKIILQLGRLSKVKNHIFSLEIAKVLKAKNEKFVLFFAGQGSLEPVLKNEVKRLNLDEVVLFLGVRSDVPFLLAGSDLMLMPSLYEGFPVVLVESQASGTPALIADSISPEVDLNTDLVYFESLKTSPESWVNKILTILSKGPKNLSERITVLKEKGFDIHESCKKLETLYKEYDVV